MTSRSASRARRATPSRATPPTTRPRGPPWERNRNLTLRAPGVRILGGSSAHADGPPRLGEFLPPTARESRAHAQQHPHRDTTADGGCLARPRPQAAPPVDDRPRRRDRRGTVRGVGRGHRRGRSVHRDRLRPVRAAGDAGDADARRDVGRLPVVRLLLGPRRAGDRPLGRVRGRLVLLGAAVHRRGPGGHRRGQDRPGLGAGQPAVDLGRAVHAGLPRHEPGRREELRRVRVLVRRAQGRRDLAVPGAGRARHHGRAAGHRRARHLTSVPLPAARRPGPGHRPARLGLRLRRPGDGHHRGGGVGGPGAGRGARGAHRDVAHRRVLHRLHGRRRHPGALELPGGRGARPLRRDPGPPRHPGRGPADGRGGVRGAAVRDERQHLRLLAHRVLPGRARPGPEGAGEAVRRGAPDRRAHLLCRGLLLRAAELLAARRRLPVAAEHDRRGDPGRLDLHRGLPAAAASPDRTGGASEAGGADVGVPVPHLGGAGRDGRGLRADGAAAGHPGPAVLVGRDDGGARGGGIRLAAGARQALILRRADRAPTYDTWGPFCCPATVVASV
ncbi:hypothetical protein SGPA1_30423 [Streptomyces misionensis JCM 4497]